MVDSLGLVVFNRCTMRSFSSSVLRCLGVRDLKRSFPRLASGRNLSRLRQLTQRERMALDEREQRLQARLRDTTRSTVVNSDATLAVRVGTICGWNPSAILVGWFRMTKASCWCNRKKDGAEMNRGVNSTLRYVPGHGRSAFRRNTQVAAPQAKFPTFPPPRVKWQTTEKDCWQRRYRD